MPSEVVTSVPHSLYESTLSAEISSSATSIKPVSTGTFQNGDVVYFSLEPKTSRKEIAQGTWNSSNAQFESCLRGLRLYGTDTEVTANKQQHSKGSQIVVSNQHSWHQELKEAINNAAFHAQVADLTALGAVTGMSQYDLRYVQAENKLYYYDGAAWQPMTTGSVSTATTTTFGTVKVSDTPAGDPVAIIEDNTTRLLSSTDKTDLTDGGDSTLHYHATDRARANHTGTQTASTVSDFDEAAMDAIAAAIALGTHTAIAITYTDASDKFDFAVQVDNSTIEVSGGQLAVKADGINDTHIDWGTGANQVSLDDVPDGSSYIRIPATGATDSHIATLAAIAWSKISKTGSNITDLTTYTHNSLQSPQGGTTAEYYHLTSAQHSSLTTYASELASFFSTTDMTGAEAEELTDGSETTKHVHALPYIAVGNGQRTTVEGTGNEDISLSFNPQLVFVVADASSYQSWSIGWSDGTNQSRLTSYNAANSQQTATDYCVYLRDGSGVGRWYAGASFPGSNVLRFAFTDNSASSDLNYNYLALR